MKKNTLFLLLFAGMQGIFAPIGLKYVDEKPVCYRIPIQIVSEANGMEIRFYLPENKVPYPRVIRGDDGSLWKLMQGQTTFDLYQGLHMMAEDLIEVRYLFAETKNELVEAEKRISLFEKEVSEWQARYAELLSISSITSQEKQAIQYFLMNMDTKLNALCSVQNRCVLDCQDLKYSQLEKDLEESKRREVMWQKDNAILAGQYAELKKSSGNASIKITRDIATTAACLIVGGCVLKVVHTLYSYGDSAKRMKAYREEQKRKEEERKIAEKKAAEESEARKAEAMKRIKQRLST